MYNKQIFSVEDSRPKYVIHPEAASKVTWDMVILILVLYNAVTLPYYVGFNIEPGLSVVVLEYCIDGLFLVDLLVSFNTAFFREGVFIFERKAIAKHYFYSWFWLDFVAVIPVEAMVPSSEQVRILAGVKCIRLLRIGRLIKHVEMWGNPNIWRLARLFVSFTILAHWVGCGWSMLNSLDEGAWFVENGLDDASLGFQYVKCLYNGFLLLVGRDIKPISQGEIIFCTCITVTGALVYATIFGNMMLIVQKLNKDEVEYREKMDSVNDEVAHLQLPDELRDRINSYYNYLWFQHRTMFAGKSFMDEVSPILKKDIKKFLTLDMIKRVPLFEDAPNGFILDMVEKLTPEIYLPGDIIVREGEVGDAMYFIISGVCVVISERTGTILAQLDRGAYFGEISLTIRERRAATVRARQVCDLRVLSKQDFDRVLHDYPQEATHIFADAERKLALKARILVQEAKERRKMGTSERRFKTKLEAELVRGLDGSRFDPQGTGGRDNSKPPEKLKLHPKYAEMAKARRRASRASSPQNLARARRQSVAANALLSFGASVLDVVGSVSDDEEEDCEDVDLDSDQSTTSGDESTGNDTSENSQTGGTDGDAAEERDSTAAQDSSDMSVDDAQDTTSGSDDSPSSNKESPSGDSSSTKDTKGGGPVVMSPPTAAGAPEKGSLRQRRTAAQERRRSVLQFASAVEKSPAAATLPKRMSRRLSVAAMFGAGVMVTPPAGDSKSLVPSPAVDRKQPDDDSSVFADPAYDPDIPRLWLPENLKSRVATGKSTPVVSSSHVLGRGSHPPATGTCQCNSGATTHLLEMILRRLDALEGGARAQHWDSGDAKQSRAERRMVTAAGRLGSSGADGDEPGWERVFRLLAHESSKWKRFRKNVYDKVLHSGENRSSSSSSEGGGSTSTDRDDNTSDGRSGNSDPARHSSTSGSDDKSNRSSSNRSGSDDGRNHKGRRDSGGNSDRRSDASNKSGANGSSRRDREAPADKHVTTLANTAPVIASPGNDQPPELRGILSKSGRKPRTKTAATKKAKAARKGKTRSRRRNATPFDLSEGGKTEGENTSATPVEAQVASASPMIVLHPSRIQREVLNFFEDDTDESSEPSPPRGRLLSPSLRADSPTSPTETAMVASRTSALLMGGDRKTGSRQRKKPPTPLAGDAETTSRQAVLHPFPGDGSEDTRKAKALFKTAITGVRFNQPSPDTLPSSSEQVELASVMPTMGRLAGSPHRLSAGSPFTGETTGMRAARVSPTANTERSSVASRYTNQRGLPIRLGQYTRVAPSGPSILRGNSSDEEEE